MNQSFVFFLSFLSFFLPAVVFCEWIQNGPTQSPFGIGSINAYQQSNNNDNHHYHYIGSSNGGVWRSQFNLSEPSTYSQLGRTPAWSPLTENNRCNSIASLAVSADDPLFIAYACGGVSSYLFYSSPFYGIYYSHDGGMNWKLANIDYGYDFSHILVFGSPSNNNNNNNNNNKGRIIAVAKAIKQKQPNDDYIWKLNYSLGALFISEDGGDTFTKINDSIIGNDPLLDIVGGSLIDNGQLLYASTRKGKIIKSIDGGYSWIDITSGLNYSSVGGGDKIVNSRVAMYYGKNDANQKLMKDRRLFLDNYYNNNKNNNYNNNKDLLIPTSDESRLFVYVCNADSAGIVGWSNDQGKSFQQSIIPDDVALYGGIFFFDILPDPLFSQYYYIVGAVDAAYRGTINNSNKNNNNDKDNDDDDNYKQSDSDFINLSRTSAQPPHADLRSLSFDIASNTLIVTCDGGIYSLPSPQSTPSQMKNWTDMNGNLQITEFDSIIYDDKTQSIASGAQDNGVWLSIKKNNKQGGDNNDNDRMAIMNTKYTDNNNNNLNNNYHKHSIYHYRSPAASVFEKLNEKREKEKKEKKEKKNKKDDDDDDKDKDKEKYFALKKGDSDNDSMDYHNGGDDDNDNDEEGERRTGILSVSFYSDIEYDYYTFQVGDGESVALNTAVNPNVMYGTGQNLGGLFAYQIGSDLSNTSNIRFINTDPTTTYPFYTDLQLNSIDQNRLLVCADHRFHCSVYNFNNNPLSNSPTISTLSFFNPDINNSIPYPYNETDNWFFSNYFYGGRINNINDNNIDNNNNNNPSISSYFESADVFFGIVSNKFIIANDPLIKKTMIYTSNNDWFLYKDSMQLRDQKLRLAVNKNNYYHMVTVTDMSRVRYSNNFGASWYDITGDLYSVTQSEEQPYAWGVELIEGANHKEEIIVIGTALGVYISIINPLNPIENNNNNNNNIYLNDWYPLGQGLPNVLISNIYYSKSDDMLIIATLGRGWWKIHNILQKIQEIKQLRIRKN